MMTENTILSKERNLNHASTRGKPCIHVILQNYFYVLTWAIERDCPETSFRAVINKIVQKWLNYTVTGAKVLKFSKNLRGECGVLQCAAIFTVLPDAVCHSGDGDKRLEKNTKIWVLCELDSGTWLAGLCKNKLGKQGWLKSALWLNNPYLSASSL